MGEAVDRYLASPWIDWAYAERLTWIPEPPDGSTVLTFGPRYWRRFDGRWHPTDYYPGGSATWAELTGKYGPHRIEVATAPRRPWQRPMRVPSPATKEIDS